MLILSEIEINFIKRNADRIKYIPEAYKVIFGISTKIDMIKLKVDQEQITINAFINGYNSQNMFHVANSQIFKDALKNWSHDSDPFRGVVCTRTDFLSLFPESKKQKLALEATFSANVPLFTRKQFAYAYMMMVPVSKELLDLFEYNNKFKFKFKSHDVVFEFPDYMEI